MTKPEQAQIILQEIDNGAYTIPSYWQEEVHTAIIKALVMIEREEMKKLEL